jgi:hypothetical protein
MRPKYSSVRARSAKEGSGRGGWLVGAPACFLGSNEEFILLQV